MDSFKIKTLQQISAALQAIAEAKANPLTPDQLDALDDATTALSAAQNHILLTAEADWATVLTPDQAALNKLVADINTAAGGLDNVANRISKIAGALGTLVTIAGSAIGSGLIP